MSAIELQGILDQHLAWINDHTTGKQLDLSNANLTGVNLTNSNLTKANIRRANLNSALLSSSDLTGAFFISSNLTNANLTNSNLTNANLTGAILPTPLSVSPAISSLTIDPKQSQAEKKINFDTVPITLKVLAVSGSQSGADKYGIWNWLKLEDGSMSLTTYLNALERHLTLYRAGQDYTSDTNIHNLDSMIAGLAVVRDAMVFGKVKDDRVKLTGDQIQTLESLINNEG